MNNFKKRMGAVAVAVAAVCAGLTHSAALAEKSSAPWFTYGLTNTGPVESQRAEYVALRDAMDAMIQRARDEAARPKALADWRAKVRAELRVRQSPEYLALADQLAAIPLEEKWAETHLNLVTTAGKNDLLTNQFKGSSYTAAWYLGLIDNASFSAIAAGDTASSHAGWIESTAYSNSTRVALSFGTASAGSLAASAASFNINGSATINGAFAITNSTKGGTTGVLYSAGSFGSTRTVANGDTLNVTLTVTA